AEERTRAPLGGNRAHDDEAAVGVDVAAGVADPLGDRGGGVDREAALDGRAFGPRADHPRVGLAAQEQAEPGQQHRLAGTRLPGDGREPGTRAALRPGDHADVLDAELLAHRGLPSAARRRPSAPRHPLTGSANRETSRSVNGPWLRRARRTGSAPRRTSTLVPSGRSDRRRPSHVSTPGVPERAMTSTATTELGPTTSGRAKSAC